MESTLQKNDNAEEILNILRSPEQRINKIFVLSNTQDIVLANTRVNEDIFQIYNKEIDQHLPQTIDLLKNLVNL